MILNLLPSSSPLYIYSLLYIPYTYLIPLTHNHYYLLPSASFFPSSFQLSSSLLLSLSYEFSVLDLLFSRSIAPDHTSIPTALHKNCDQTGLDCVSSFLKFLSSNPQSLPSYDIRHPTLTTHPQSSKYLLDPLTGPEPSQETGPGTHFSSSMDQKAPAYTAYPTPPTSASPSRTTFSSTNPWRSSQRTEAFGNYAQDGPAPTSTGKAGESSHRRRASSLSQRYPGDLSNRPLDMIRKQTKAADRSPHLKKNHLPKADLIDRLDDSMGSLYHHEGPYDATLLSRNTRPESSPLEAVRGSTNETLKATPTENIRDALDKHVPLQGTAVVPPGERSMSGEMMDYDEGADLMRDNDAPGGAYRRWEGIVRSSCACWKATKLTASRSTFRKTTRARASRHSRSRGPSTRRRSIDASCPTLDRRTRCSRRDRDRRGSGARVRWPRRRSGRRRVIR